MTAIMELAAKIAASLYGVQPGIYPFRSARSHVFRLDFGDRLESKILKIADVGKEADVLREQQIIPALHARGFEVPRIEFTQENTGFSVPFTAMEFVTGGRIDDVNSMAPAVANAAYEHLGHFMARLSVLDAQTIPGARSCAEVTSQIEQNWATGDERLRLHPRCTARLASLLKQGCDLQKDTSGFVHWDGPQVITDGVNTFTVIDWGGAGAGHRLADLGAFLSHHGFWASLQLAEGMPVYSGWRESVLRGFSGGRTLTEELHMRLHTIGMSLCILDAMVMAKRHNSNVSKASDDLLTFIETEDAAIQTDHN